MAPDRPSAIVLIAGRDERDVRRWAGLAGLRPDEWRRVLDPHHLRGYARDTTLFVELPGVSYGRNFGEIAALVRERGYKVRDGGRFPHVLTARSGERDVCGGPGACAVCEGARP